MTSRFDLGRTLLASTLLLALLAALPGCSGGSDAELLASARSAIAKNDNDAARLELKSLLQRNPDAGEARFLLGQVMLASGDMPAAEAELRRALELGYPEATVLPLLAEALVALNKGSVLLQQYGKLTLPDAKADAALKTQLALAAAADNDNERADAWLAQALRGAPDHVPALLLRARLAASRGDADGALAQVEALIARQAGNADAWALKGELLQRGRPPELDAALAAYLQAIQLRPDALAAHTAAIGLLLAKPDLPAATAQWTALQKVAPRHAQTLFFEALLAEQRGDFKRARELSQQLLRGAPNSPQLLLLAGQAEFKLGALAQAETLFAKAVQLLPKAALPRRQLAQVQLRSSQPDKVINTLRPLVEANPPDADALTLVAQAQLMAGDNKAADASFARAAKLRPDDARLRTALALAQLGKGQDAAVLNELQAIAASDKGIGTDMALISARVRSKDLAGAQKAVDVLATKMPGQPLPDQLRGRLALMRSDSAAARKAFGAALVHDADYMPALAGLAALDLIDKQPAAAKARFEKLLERKPGHAGAMMALAEIGARAGDKPEQTVQWLEQAVKAEPGDPAPRLLLVDQYLTARQLKPALTAVQAALSALPDNTDLLDRLGRTHLLMGEAQQAVTAFNKLAGLMPKSPLPQLRLADAQAAANNRSGAAAAVRRATELAPGSVQVQQAQINLALLEDKPDQALVLARALQARQPDDALGFAIEGDIELRQKHWDNAAVALRKAIARKDPGDSAQRLHAALVAGKKIADADKLAADWRKSHPDDMAFVLQLGDVALSRGDQPQAEANYRLVVERQPANVVAINNLAYLLAMQKKPGAVALAERALAAAPDTPALMDTLAFALAAEQQLPRAIEMQARAVAAAPSAPQFALQLAKLQLQSGDKAAARAELHKLAKLGDAYPRQAEVSALLQSSVSN